MLILGFIIPTLCLTEMLSPSLMYVTSSFLVSDASTVHYIQTKVNQFDGNRIDKDSEAPTKTSIFIYKDRIYDSSNLVYKDEKTVRENTFFFTSSSQGKYFVVMQIDNPEKVSVGLDYIIYSGEANRPAIISNNDIEVSRAEGLIKNLLEYVKKNIAMQNLDMDGDQEYKEIYSGMFSKALFVVFAKIMAVVFTLTYSSWKTKKFFTSQGIAGN